MTSETAAIEAVLWTYLDGLHEGDADKIATAFHPVSHLYSEANGEAADVPREKWLEMVRGPRLGQVAGACPPRPHRDHRPVGAGDGVRQGRMRRSAVSEFPAFRHSASKTRVNALQASYGLLAFPGRARVDGKGVHAACEFPGQRRIHHAVPLDAGLARKGIGNDIDPEMGLPARPVTGMAGVLMGFVDHAQALGRESFGQLLRDEIAGVHGRPGISPSRATRQWTRPE
jgi:putative lumazine-binding protein